MGLYDFASGLGINEAAVQLMASEANFGEISEEKYFDINIKTISPDYYPLECSLVNQISYFTGAFPLYHSTLNGDDVFKNTFIAKSDKRTYSRVLENIDRLLFLENDLNFFATELQYADREREIKALNNFMTIYKERIVRNVF